MKRYECNSCFPSADGESCVILADNECGDECNPLRCPFMDLNRDRDGSVWREVTIEPEPAAQTDRAAHRDFLSSFALSFALNERYYENPGQAVEAAESVWRILIDVVDQKEHHDSQS